MNDVANANRERPLAAPRSSSIRAYARITGFLFLVSMVAGFFGELYVPSKLIVSNDAVATARNIGAAGSLFRLGFASYLVEAVCDIVLTLLLYVLLRPVRKDLALLAAFFGLVSTALFGVAELFYFATTIILGGGDWLKTFSPEQLDTAALFSLKLYGFGGGIFMVFYGVAAVIRGYLIVRSTYLPRALGILLMVAGLGFIARNFVLVLTPAYASDLLLLPMSLAVLSLTVWLLVRGIDAEQWNTMATRVHGSS